MITAIIIDDEPSNIENLWALLQKHCPQVNVFAGAGDVATAEKQISQHQPDLLFLDIQLKDETGFDLLKLLPVKNFEVIFVTAFDHYGIQAIKYAALDYLLKPVDIDELTQAVAKAELKVKSRQSNQQLEFLISNLKKDDAPLLKIALPQQKEIRYVLVSNIIRCEADDTYTFFFLNDGDKILVSKPLKEYADLLQPNGFLRTHQSHLVNVSHIRSWLKEDGGTLQMEDGSKVPVSKPNRERVKAGIAGLFV
ncbi:two component transcriptional regulator, LytTR family [Mucilaginibacter pineti]|uniref:Two component transcriptional regulator, LytTR family n=1 Tax=Mucilaginibacter pineti TaxID=1391627 RepID=A0A1G6W335_9SPHI|nr:LytTR family DNA-binding domain-containing protein [Mucilaginibacter pineti]SDD59456.1 two component transcriptional regulator, LytTR family [Mucilaginibacter pineti]